MRVAILSGAKHPILSTLPLLLACPAAAYTFAAVRCESQAARVVVRLVTPGTPLALNLETLRCGLTKNSSYLSRLCRSMGVYTSLDSVSLSVASYLYPCWSRCVVKSAFSKAFFRTLTDSTCPAAVYEVALVLWYVHYLYLRPRM